MRNFRINGHTDGCCAMSFRVDAAGNLVVFAGDSCKSITIDRKETFLTDDTFSQFAFAPVHAIAK